MMPFIHGTLHRHFDVYSCDRVDKLKVLSFYVQVESIVLSIISMLSSPNDESPANVEAAVS